MAGPATGRAPAQRPGGDDADRVARILLVNDARRFLELLKTYLKRTTCRVTTARTAAEALRVSRQEPPEGRSALSYGRVRPCEFIY